MSNIETNAPGPASGPDECPRTGRYRWSGDTHCGVGRGIVLLGGVAAALVAMTMPASAHVTVNAPGATQGGQYQLVTVKVPNESDTASTVDVKLALPSDTPLIGVSVQPVAGWAVTATTAKLTTPIKQGDDEITESVTQIEWKASAGAGIGPNQFQQFVISVGQLPKTPTVTFKAVQTYSDGTVTNWIDVPAAGSTQEPEHPAPTLTLVAAGSNNPSPSPTATVPAATNDGSNWGKVGAGLGGGALVVALAALALALRGRRGAAQS